MQQEIATSTLDLQTIMDLIVERSCTICHATGGIIEIAEGDDMVYRACSAASKPHQGSRIKRAGSLSGLCVATGEILKCDDSETDPRVDREMCRKVNLRSMVVVPLRHQGTTVGVLKVLSAAPHAFDDQTVAILQMMSGLLASALAQATNLLPKTRR